jgi:HPt (histidine-containing phosphotransfer) domain-containing protein
MVDMDLLNARIAALTEDYRAKLPERLEFFQSLSDQINEDSDIDFITELRHNAHKLAGSAGSYGFTELGEIASEVDTLCKQVIEDPDKRAETILDISEKLSALVASLKTTAD